jgi:hypothetical protein
VKALVYEKAHDLHDFTMRLVEVVEPTLRDLDVLVEIHAIGINPGEAFIRRTRSAERVAASSSGGSLPVLSFMPDPQYETSRLEIEFLAPETCRETAPGRSA